MARLLAAQPGGRGVGDARKGEEIEDGGQGHGYADCPQGDDGDGRRLANVGASKQDRDAGGSGDGVAAGLETPGRQHEGGGGQEEPDLAKQLRRGNALAGYAETAEEHAVLAKEERQ